MLVLYRSKITFPLLLHMMNGILISWFHIGILAIQATSTIAIIHVPFTQLRIFTPFVHIFSLCNNDDTFASKYNIILFHCTIRNQICL